LKGEEMDKYPEPPVHVGTKAEITDRDGNRQSYIIVDEIIEKENEEKAIYLQVIEFNDKHVELCLRYWIIGSEEKRMAGRWAFGQFSPMISTAVFERIVKKAKEKGWIK
jgi:hypothetical protein